VKFKAAVENVTDLRDAWKPGLQALKPESRDHIDAADNSQLRGSVDLDTALKSLFPSASRWDYGIGHRPENIENQDVVYWIEIHPATDGEVKSVINKVQWLKNWLRTAAKDLNSLPRKFIWISTGSTKFTPGSPQQKRLSQENCEQVGRFFTIPKTFKL
jgi:hypothetical protein